MKVLEDIVQGSSEWFSFREGKITGAKLGGIFAKQRGKDDYDTNKRNVGFWQIVAERLAEGTGDDGEGEDGIGSSRQRGKDLEEAAFERCKEELGLVDLERGKVWLTDKEDHIHSPDANTPDGKIACEIKCVNSAAHIKAIYEDNPYELGKTNYLPQFINYFIANPVLEKLVVFIYDPRFIVAGLQWHAWTLTREDMTEKIKRMTEVRDEALAQIDAVVRELYERYKG